MKLFIIYLSIYMPELTFLINEDNDNNNSMIPLIITKKIPHSRIILSALVHFSLRFSKAQ